MAEDRYGLHTELIDKIGRMDDRHGPAMLRDLLLAEATARRAPALVEVSTEVHCADGGIDGVTRFGFDLPVIDTPAGHVIWQVKTHGTRPDAAKELGAKARHEDAQTAVRQGAHYVLVWTWDPPSKTRTEVTKAFADAARAIRDSATVTVLTAQNIANWAWTHPVVAAQLLPLGGLCALEPLKGTEVENGTTGVEDTIRLYLRFPTLRALRVTGPVGQGKKTAIRVAASTPTEPIEVLVAADPDGAPIEILTSLAHRGCVVAVVIHRCPPERAAALEHLVALSDGNLRLITEGVENGAGYLEATDIVTLSPMMPNMERRLLDALQIPPLLAAELVGTTAGNPRLLTAIASGDTAADGTLTRVTAGLDLRALAAFALMPPLGADDTNLSIISSTFEVTERVLEDTAVDCASRNLILWSGRTQLPRAIAAFAIAKAFRDRRGWLLRGLERLPDKWVIPAIAPLAAAGPIAGPAIEALLRRSDQLPSEESDDPDNAIGLLDRMSLASSASDAATEEALRRLCDLVRRYPWADRTVTGFTRIATQDLLHTARRIDRAHGGKGPFGAQLVLEIVAASGFQGGPLRAGLRDLLHRNAPDYLEQLHEITTIAESLGPAAVQALEAATES